MVGMTSFPSGGQLGGSQEASQGLLYTLVPHLRAVDPNYERPWVAVLARAGDVPVVYRAATEAEVRALVAAHPDAAERVAFAIDRIHDDYFSERSAPDLLASFDRD